MGRLLDLGLYKIGSNGWQLEKEAEIVASLLIEPLRPIREFRQVFRATCNGMVLRAVPSDVDPSETTLNTQIGALDSNTGSEGNKGGGGGGSAVSSNAERARNRKHSLLGEIVSNCYPPLHLAIHRGSRAGLYLRRYLPTLDLDNRPDSPAEWNPVEGESSDGSVYRVLLVVVLELEFDLVS